MLLFALIASTGPVGAYAADVAADTAPVGGAQGLEEIVITAQRAAQSSRDVPISVTALGPALIAQADIRSVGDLQLGTPDLTYTQQFGYTRNYIRGIGSSFATPGLESPVAVYVDGGYIERGFGTIFDLLDPGVIEVLKGPQGTLYGRNATGGAILVNSADPTDKNEGHVTVEGGNFDHALGEFVVNLPITSTLSARVAAREEHDGGYIHDFTTNSDLGEHRSSQFRGKLRWTPDNDFTAVLSVEHSDVNESLSSTSERAPAPICLACAFPGSGAPVTGFYNTVDDVTQPAVFTTWNSNLHLNYSTDLLKFASVTTYRKDYGRSAADLDATAIPLIEYQFSFHSQLWTQDFQVSTNSSGWINGLIAGSYLHDNGLLDSGENGLAFAPLVAAVGESPYTSNRVITQSTAGLAEIYLTPVEGLKVTLGGRYTHEAKTLYTTDNIGAIAANGVPPTTPNPFTQNATFSSFTPRAVIAYDFGLVNTYASFNKGFKSGGFNTPISDLQTPIKPERIDSYEIGAKLVSPDHSIHANVALFHYLYSDVQVSVINIATGGQTIQNAASAIGNGFEGDMAYKAASWVEFNAGASYLHARFTNYPNASVAAIAPTGGLAQGTEDLKGTPLAEAPNVTANIGAVFNAELGYGWSGTLSANARYSSGFDFYPGAGGPIGYDRQGAFTLVNMTGDVGPTNGHYKVGLYVDNLLNKKYYSIRDTEAPFGIFDTPARPLTFGARATYKW